MVKVVGLLIFVGFASIITKSNAFYTNGIDVPLNELTVGDVRVFSNPLDLFRGLLKRRCPVCDPSVYSYCTDKLFHDSCCCHNPNNTYDQLPYQCKFADCSFLHANTCPEHKLITACCCTGSPYK